MYIFFYFAFDDNIKLFDLWSGQLPSPTVNSLCVQYLWSRLFGVPYVYDQGHFQACFSEFLDAGLFEIRCTLFHMQCPNKIEKNKHNCM
jgi:hypothetical protein